MKKKIKSLFWVSNKYCQQLSLELISRLNCQLLYNCIYGSNANMRLKNIICLKNQKEIYLIEEEDGDFTYSVTKLSKYVLSLKCRKWKCSRRLQLHPVHKFLALTDEQKCENIVGKYLITFWNLHFWYKNLCIYNFKNI